jgi:hypothetical protein
VSLLEVGCELSDSEPEKDKKKRCLSIVLNGHYKKIQTCEPKYQLVCIYVYILLLPKTPSIIYSLAVG